MSIGNFPESLSQAILVGIILVGRLGVWVINDVSLRLRLVGCQGDATPFTRVTVKDISGRLHDMGFQRFGNERVMNGHLI